MNPTTNDPVALDPESIVGLNRDETRALYREIFLEQEYLPPDFRMPGDATVIDVGANIGMFSLFVHARWPTARLLAFEPVPAIFAALRRNLTRHRVPGKAFAYGLSDREQSTDFTWFPQFSAMSTRTSYADVDAEKRLVRASMTDAASEYGLDDVMDEMLEWRFQARREQVRLRPTSAVLDEYHVERVDLLKIDVQRAEVDVLDGIEDRHWPLVQAITMELHDDPAGWTAGRGDAVSRRLTDRGFTVTLDQPAGLIGSDRLALWAHRP